MTGCSCMTPLQCSTEFKTSENFDTQFGTQTGEANISEYNGEEIAIYYSKEGLCRRLVNLELNLSTRIGINYKNTGS